MKNLFISILLLLSTVVYSQSSCPGIDSINYSGQWYHTVQIGTQCWLKENLNIGTQVNTAQNQSNNDTVEKYCYNDDPANCTIYGGLYQWREAMQYTTKSKARGICPVGWHIPSHAEIDTLKSIVHSDGNSLLNIGQGSGTNTSGFSAMLTGERYIDGNFFAIGSSGLFWISNSVALASGGGGATYRLYSDETAITSGGIINIYNGPTGPKADNGVGIRCLNDSAGLFLQSPYGGENWLVGSSHNIVWGGGNVSDLKIDYTTDNGASWINIIASAPFINGNYSWTVPNTPSLSCKVRISDLNNSGTWSVSDNVFSIISNPCPAGSVVQHGGQFYNTVVIGSKCWFKENVNIGTMIPVSQDPITNGIIEKYCYNNDTANCSIYGGMYTLSEISEPGFCPVFWHFESIVYPLVQVMYDANALKAVGQGTGLGSGSNTSGFSILLAGSRNSGPGDVAWFPDYWYIYQHKIIAEYLDATTTLVSWTDTFQPMSGGSARCVRDDVGPLQIKSPVGGENWLIDSTQKISWSYSNVTNLKIDYTTDNGTTWINIIPSTPADAGSYNWIIPNTPSTNCKVKISSVSSSDTNSISNVFQIYQVPINPCPGIPTVEYGGQTYNTIAIGDQCWLKENLNIGTMIDSTQYPSNNAIIEKYCYNDDSVKCSIYGGLYQWDEAMQYSTADGTQGICPTGWHIPKWSEFLTLMTFVNNNGHKLKEVGQGWGTNESGFSALLAGVHNNSTFYFLGQGAVFWSSTSSDATSAYYFELISNNSTILGGPTNKTIGSSIRCINDSLVSALPVELITFTLSLNNNDVILNWNTATEINCASFEIEKKTGDNGIWQKIVSVQASGNSNSPKSYSYKERNVNSGKYSYRLKIVDINGTSKFSSILNLEVAPPIKYELDQNYPNPWNPTTTIRYQVPLNIFVTIKVFDALGREVATLVNEPKLAGNYEVVFNGHNLASGIYYYQMKAGNFIDTKKITLIK